MRKRFFFLVTALGFAPAACQNQVSAEPEPAEPVIIAVSAIYQGANCQVVAETIAAPIEQQMNGAEGLLRIESESRNDGGYTARLRFKPKTDPQAAMKIIEKRVALAEPVLPDLVRRNKISVKLAKPEKSENQVTIALVDRGEHGFDALSKLADALAKQMANDGTIVKPAVFPRSENHSLVHIDRKKCSQLGVSPADVNTVVQAAGPTASIEALKELKVRSDQNQIVPLAKVATFEPVTGPAAVYRVNLYPAIRITGEPPKDRSVAESAARVIESIQDELKRADAKGIAVENLSAK